MPRDNTNSIIFHNIVAMNHPQSHLDPIIANNVQGETLSPRYSTNSQFGFFRHWQEPFPQPVSDISNAEAGPPSQTFVVNSRALYLLLLSRCRTLYNSFSHKLQPSIPRPIRIPSTLIAHHNGDHRRKIQVNLTFISTAGKNPRPLMSVL